MKKRIIILLIILIIAVVGIYIYNSIIVSESNKDTGININTTYDDTDIDWNGYETTEIELTDSLTITKEGIYILSGTLNGSVTVNTDGYVKLILNGVTITNDSGPAINIENAKKLYIELKDDTINNLTDGGSSEEFDGALYSCDDLIIDGKGTLNITANNQDGIVSKDNLIILNGIINITSKDDGIRGKDYVVIKDGTINITSDGDGIKSTNDTDSTLGYILIEGGTITTKSKLDAFQAETDIKITGGTFDITTGSGSGTTSTNVMWGRTNTTSTSTESKKAIKAINNIIITGGTFTINSEDDSIHSNNSINIIGGEFTIKSGDDGIHADTKLVIDGGTINIEKSYEGLESANITINGGTITVTASDDGINVAGGNDSSSMNRQGANNYTSSSSYVLTINDGDIYVNADGDGLDSNGSIYINGGTILVDGPTNDGNGAIDYDNELVIKGGILVASGSSGMAQGISSNSTQNGVLINFTSNNNANTIVNIEGIITYKPSKTYSSILVSTPNIKTNTSYKVSLGGSASGDNKNGLYTNEVYTDGTTYTTYTQSSVATTVGDSMQPGMRR